ncbi:HAD family hydrolase [Actinospica durhamensis]|uniref:HAD family hydrolase n=1 Tax=Actinospica durhamensis TaxID=1508375 RepID=A0A941ESW6_9ACTN|nr:HAD family hydrolase [Actinospica durhamensis]MBR7836701.1 HAD family hydrolase [Actinospica durhamensis]
MTATPAKFALFDLDDTLVVTSEPFRAFCHEFVLRYAVTGVPGVADGGDVDAATAQLLSARIATTSWRKFCDKAEEWYGITAPREELFAWVLATYPAKFTLDPRVAKGLAALRADGWKLGIVTNGTTAVQQAKVDHAGLRAYVDFVIESDAAGARKPDPRIFEVAAEGLGVELGPHGWMVGDNHACDIVGGHGVGLRTIWLPYDNVQPADAIRPDHACATILEAIEIVAAGDAATARDAADAE